MTRFGARSGILTGALAAALVLAACSTPPPPPAPPAPPPPPPPVALAPIVPEAAASYVAYVNDARQISATFADAESIQASLRRGAAFEPRSLARGAVAFAAVAVMRDSDFVRQVRDTYAVDPAIRQEIVNRIFSDPAYATTLPGASQAAGAAVRALSADGQAVEATGRSVKQSAYDIQRQRWSRAFIPEATRTERLNAVKALATQPTLGSTDEQARLMQTALGGPTAGASTVEARAPYTQTVVRALAISALAALGAAGEDNATSIDSLLNETTGPSCLNMSKLNLNQCLAVAKPHFEDVFCLGQHVLIDAGQCLTKVAGDLAPAAPALPAQSFATTPAAVDAEGASAPASAAQAVPATPAPRR